MNLKVLQSDSANTAPPWYSGGLHFTCTQCGNCCTGPTGYVWISPREIQRLAEHLKLSPDQVTEKYCRSVGNKYSLKEVRNARGEYDCIFLREEKTGDGRKGPVVFTRRTCAIYNSRPLQCRTWPFWEGNLVSPESWKRSAERCHGMNNGSRAFSQEQIEALRDARDWPKKPPTSRRSSD